MFEDCLIRMAYVEEILYYSANEKFSNAHMFMLTVMLRPCIIKRGVKLNLNALKVSF
jgi:hypothetical protein